MNNFLENKIFMLFLFLFFMIWSVLIIFYLDIDNRLDKIENKIYFDMEVNYEDK